MRKYSHFFSTIHDQPEPIGNLGGVHYSIVRAITFVTHEPSYRILGPCQFHDICVLWDEDHDTRVFWILEQLVAGELIHHVAVIGERKGHLEVQTVPTFGGPVFEKRVGEILSAPIPTDDGGDLWEPFFDVFPATHREYLLGIDALWQLGTKPLYFGDKKRVFASLAEQHNIFGDPDD